MSIRLTTSSLSSFATLLLILALPGSYLVESGKKWLKYRASRNWPMTTGQVLEGSLKLVRTGGRVSTQALWLEVWFQYRVSDEVYSGEYREVFDNVQEAEQLLRSMKEAPLFVRYKPGDPRTYVMDPYRDVRLTAA